jgi:peroxiredoxin Q/BCP
MSATTKARQAMKAVKALRIGVLASVLATGLGTALPAWAALDVGDKAPDFTADAALAGKRFRFSLAEALAKGPVVLYFFPAAFSDACSIEAHAFAEAMPDFEALGATVVGVSGDDLATLSRFSVQSCQSRFPVASDAGLAIVRSYEAAMTTRPDYANRVSYVIAPAKAGGTVAYQYTSLNPARHVEKTLAALRAWRDGAAGKP